jgi:hypothetical protein
MEYDEAYNRCKYKLNDIRKAVYDLPYSEAVEEIKEILDAPLENYGEE